MGQPNERTRIVNGKRRAPGLARVLITGAIIALAAAGCSSSSSSAGSSSGNTVDIYSSLPMQGTSSAQTLPMVNGIKLALSQAHNTAGKFTVKYVKLDDSPPPPANCDPTPTPPHPPPPPPAP